MRTASRRRSAPLAGQAKVCGARSRPISGAANEVVTGAVGPGTGGTPARVAGTVLVTAAAGVVFCVLCLRSRSLLAPALLHWAVNGLGVLFVRIA